MDGGVGRRSGGSLPAAQVNPEDKGDAAPNPANSSGMGEEEEEEEEGVEEVFLEVKSKELKMLLGCDRVALVPSLSDTVRP